METVLISYLIGFAMAWTLGASPSDFPQSEPTPQETTVMAQLQSEIEEDPEEIASRVSLGQIYFFQNQLHQADQILEEAKNLAPEDAEVLAWWGTNQTKLAGSQMPWCWGICKILSLKDGVDAINEAVARAPHNPTIRLVRINTLTALKGRFSEFDLVFEDEQYFTAKTPAQRNEIPNNLMAQIYLALAKAYVWKFQEKSATAPYRQKALAYLKQAEEKDSKLQADANKIRQSL